MMRFLLPLVLFMVGLGGGVGAGLIQGSGSDPITDATTDETVSAVAENPNSEAGSGENEDDVSEDPDPPRVEQTGSGTEYVRLNNQFVVPIIRNGSVRSLVVMGLTVEVTTGENNLVFDQEPRLRDSFLRVMFAHANAGGFDGMFTEADSMEPLREGLRETARRVLGNAVAYDVLITDITRQDA